VNHNQIKQPSCLWVWTLEQVRHDKFLRVAPPIQRQAATPLGANTAFGQGANSAPDLFSTTSLT